MVLTLSEGPKSGVYFCPANMPTELFTGDVRV